MHIFVYMNLKRSHFWGIALWPDPNTVKPLNNGHQGTKENVRYESVKKDCPLNGGYI